jgi:F-type H+-transporting ATPase subunit epsilon
METQNTFHFELISPEARVVSEPAWQVTVPGSEGDVGVRAGHMSLVMSMRPGVVEIIREENGSREKFFVAGGFADVGADHCTVLAEQTFDLASLKIEHLEQEMRNLSDDAKLADTDEEKARIASHHSLVSAMLAAARAHR